MFVGGKKREGKGIQSVEGLKIPHEVLTWYIRVAFVALTCVLHRQKVCMCVFVTIIVFIASYLKGGKIFILQITISVTNLHYESSQYLHLMLSLLFPLLYL